MVQKTVPAAKRLPNARYRELRRARIFMRLREGRPRTEIAGEEGVTDTRIRQIIRETLKKRVVDPPTDDAMLQLMRLEPALRLAAEAVVSGDIKAVRYYLKLLDQLDRRQPAAAAPQACDDAARERLDAKMGRTATRLIFPHPPFRLAEPKPPDDVQRHKERGDKRGRADVHHGSLIHVRRPRFHE